MVVIIAFNDLAETMEELEKRIKNRRLAVPALRNQETASELSDAANNISKAKSTWNIEIDSAVNQR